jgi:ABC-2 type transport system permease protein
VRRVLAVARRELLERLRSKAFLIGTVLGPVLLVALMLVPSLVMSRQRGDALRVAVLDDAGGLKPELERALARQRDEAGRERFVVREDSPASREGLEAEVREGRLDGFLHLRPDALERSAAEYCAQNVSNVLDLRLLDRATEETLIARRLAAAGVDPARLADLMRPLELRTIRITSSGAREDRRGAFLLSVTLMMMLYTSVVMWGQAVMSGVIEEKGNRVVEVIVSSIPTRSLFAGKLLGVGAAGLLQFLVWTLSLALVALYAAGAGAAGGALPEMPPLLLVSFVVFFLLGYFLYAALYAAVGAAVNTVQEAQSLVFPVLLPLVVGMMFFPAVIQSPDSTLAVALSLVPPLTPLLMFLRISVVTPPAWQILLSVLFTLAAIAAVLAAAARIYRVGILMYGKRPTFPEIVRWVGRA